MHSTLDTFTTIGTEISTEHLEQVAGGRPYDHQVVIVAGPCFPPPYDFDVLTQ